MFMLCNGQKYNNLFFEELIAHSQPKTSQRVLNKNKPTWTKKSENTSKTLSITHKLHKFHTFTSLKLKQNTNSNFKA